MPRVGPQPRADDPLAHLYRTDPPPDAPVHRGWVVWYDDGLYQTGIVYRETAWWAQSPAGDRVQAHGWSEVLDAVDDIVDLLGGDDQPRQPKR